jgi:translation initiation factor IF-3
MSHLFYFLISIFRYFFRWQKKAKRQKKERKTVKVINILTVPTINHGRAQDKSFAAKNDAKSQAS